MLMNLNEDLRDDKDIFIYFDNKQNDNYVKYVNKLLNSISIMNFYYCNTNFNLNLIERFQIKKFPAFLFLSKNIKEIIYIDNYSENEINNWFFNILEKLLIIKATQEIENGNIISFPTETVFSLSCDAYNVSAINKIYSLKQRDLNKPCSVFIQNLLILKELAIIPEQYNGIIYSILQDGNTVILEKKHNNILPFIKENSLGIRFPKHSFSQNLLKNLVKPIIATSVNLSDQIPLNNAEAIEKQFPKIAFIINENWILDPKPSEQPSKIISFLGNEPKIIR